MLKSVFNNSERLFAMEPDSDPYPDDYWIDFEPSDLTFSENNEHAICGG
ncbi:hypothetical protein NST41_33180 [Paenibacillus sp. FSL L8-0696]